MITVKQFDKRVKLQMDHPDHICLSVDVNHFYQFYLSYLDNNKYIYTKLGMNTPNTLKAVERLIDEGRLEWAGGTLKFNCDGDSVESYPQKYVDDTNEAQLNMKAPRFAILGFGIYLDSR